MQEGLASEKQPSQGKLFPVIAPSLSCLRCREEQVPTGRVTAQLHCGYSGCNQPARISCAFTVSLITTESQIGAAG